MPAVLEPYLQAVANETLADRWTAGSPPAGVPAARAELDAGSVAIGLRRIEQG
jgi:hypothetical protein